jgi:hypothetical protein
MARQTPQRCARNRPRGLRVLLWAGAVFALGQLVGGLVLDQWGSRIRFPQVEWVFERLRELPRPPDVVCLGSSRFQAAIRTDGVGSMPPGGDGRAPCVFNAAVGAGDAVVAERILDRMLAEGQRPALVVLEVCPENLARRSYWLDQHVMRMLTWWDMPEYFFAACFSRQPLRLVSARLLPLYLHRYQLRKQAAAALLGEWALPDPAAEAARAAEEFLGPTRGTGGLPSAAPGLPAVPPRDAHLLWGLLDLQSWLGEYEVGGVVPRALERVLARCRDEGIAVLLLAPPLSGPHQALYTPAIEEAFQGYLASLAQRYGCRFADCRNQIPDDYFRNHDHLNEEGATYFSGLLAEDVLLPLWHEVRPQERADETGEPGALAPEGTTTSPRTSAPSGG